MQERWRTKAHDDNPFAVMARCMETLLSVFVKICEVWPRRSTGKPLAV